MLNPVCLMSVLDVQNNLTFSSKNPGLQISCQSLINTPPENRKFLCSL